MPDLAPLKYIYGLNKEEIGEYWMTNESKHFEKILVPIDGSDNSKRALSYAIDFAKKYDSALTLIHIVRSPATLVSGPAEVFVDITRQLEEFGKKLLTESLAKVQKAGIKGDTRLSQGHPGIKIVQVADDERFDLIVIGSRGLSSLGRLFLGSTSEYVSNNAKCAILVVK